MIDGHDMENGHDIRLKPGEKIWLDNSQMVWQVQEGTVDVIVVMASDSLRYQQLFLFEAQAGQTLFGLSAQFGAKHVRLMLSAAREVTFKTMTQTHLLTQVKDKDVYLLEDIWVMIEEWLEALFRGCVDRPAPRNFRVLNADDTVDLKAGEVVRATEKMIWIRTLSGEIQYGFAPNFTISHETEIPLIKKGWLTAVGDTVIQGVATKTVFSISRIDDSVSFWHPLTLGHQLFNTLILEYFAGQEKRENERLVERKKQQEKLLRGAAVHLLHTDMNDLPLISTENISSSMLIVIKIIAVQLGVPEERVRFPLGMDTHRQDDVMLKNIANLAGMQIRLVSLDKGWHYRDNGPLVGYYGPDNRPVALVVSSPGRYCIYDPEGANGVVLTDEVAGDLSKNAFVFYAGVTTKDLSMVGWFKFMLSKCWPGDGWTIAWASLAVGIIPILIPLVTQTIFADIIPINDRQGHIMVVQVMAVAAFASACVTLTRGIALLRVKRKSLFVAEAALWIRLLALPTAFFRKYQAGDLANRMGSMTQISLMLSSAAMSTVFNVIFSFCSLFVMAYYSFKLTLLVVVVWAVYFFIAVLLVLKMLTYKRKMATATGNTAGRILQIVSGISKFRMQGAENQAFYLWAKQFGEEWKWNRAIRWKSNWLEFINVVQPVVLSMLVFWLTMFWLGDGTKANSVFMTQPEFMGFNAALGGLNAAVVGMFSVIVSLLDIVPLTERILPILQAEPEVNDEKVEAGELLGLIEMNKVSFRYSADKPIVIRDISMTIQAGQFIAVVGGSGSGKSTLLRLLLGFEQPESGSIFFDGQDFSELNISSIRSQMGVVLQNGQLMAGDIFTNIVGALPLTEDDAWHAAEMVGLAEDIRAMPMGIHTIISEGASNISGGQRQRILIARSIVNHPRIIIFDEATSALDNQTQAIVTKSIDKLKATRIIVAHRLSTIIKADVIYVMDKGQIVEHGKYEELMKMEGLFAALAKRQLA